MELTLLWEEDNATQVNQYMRVDRAPYWKDGAIAVKVVQKGSLSR